MKKSLLLVAAIAMAAVANAQTWQASLSDTTLYAQGANISDAAALAIYTSEPNTGVTYTYYTDSTLTVKSGDDKKGKEVTEWYKTSVNETSIRTADEAPDQTVHGITYNAKCYMQGSTNGMYYAFVPTVTGSLDVEIKMGNNKATWVTAVGEGMYTALETTKGDVATLISNAAKITDVDAIEEGLTYPEVTANVITKTGEPAEGFTRSVRNDSVNTSGADQWMVLSFNVTAGETYLVACNGSKLMLRGATLFDAEGNVAALAGLKSEAIKEEYYNILGQRVAANAKGLVIVNGKKMINK